MSNDSEAAQIGDLRLEIDVAAPPATVWRALTRDLGSWWPQDCFSGGEAGRRSFELEAVPGGLMREVWEDGGGLLWGTVTTADPERLLQVQGATFPKWGGPNLWFGTWRLEATDGGTRLTFEESTVGKVTPENLAEKQGGWSYLWDVALRAHLAGEPCPPFGG